MLLQTIVFIQEIRGLQTNFSKNYLNPTDGPSWVWIHGVDAPDPALERCPDAVLGSWSLQRHALELAAATCGWKSKEQSRLGQLAASGAWMFMIQK